MRPLILAALLSCAGLRDRNMVKWVVLLFLAACGFPKPADVSGEVPIDAPDPPVMKVTVLVSTAGSDGNDGFTAPVATLKRAIAIAADRKDVTNIQLEAGKYQISSGETFPYQVQSSITIAGPSGGGAVLSGNSTVPGFIIDAGTLQ